MSKIDWKEVEALLDAIRKSKLLHGVYASNVNPSLAQKMDKYDMLKMLGDYENVSTLEYPVLAKTSYPSSGLSGSTMNIPSKYASIAANAFYSPSWGSGMYMAPGMYMGIDTAADSTEDPHTKLKAKITNLENIAPAKVANSTPRIADKAPDYMHTLTGWRAWEVGRHMLKSVGTSFHWYPKQSLKAHCIHNPHAAPQMSCSCGYWSFKTLDGIKEAVKGYVSGVRVIGQVEIWGRVIECSNGFRSEFAYPKELWLLGDGLEHLSWEYGVPVRVAK